jgi:adenylate cyclase
VTEPGQRRKLAAILSADVAGYSRLMQDDDAATVETLTKYRTIFNDFVSRHEGRIVDSPGDNILAEFDSPVEAVQCAVELQREFARRNLQLAEHRQMQFRIGINLGDILSRDDGTIYGDGVNVAARLESLAEPGGIMISESARMQVRSLIDVSIADAGEHEVKNIAEPVHVYRIVLDETAAKPQKPRKVSRTMITTTAVIVLVIAIVVGVGFQPGDEPEDPILAMPSGPTLAVLPFNNLSGDPEQEYFSDGITEEIIAEFARYKNIYVLARNSTFQYKNRAVDVRQLREELGADYVLEGSVRRAGDRIRVTAQFIDAETGNHLWAETYDRDLTAVNLFDLQDEITDQVVGAIGGIYGIVYRAGLENARGKPPEHLNSYQCVLQARRFIAEEFNPEQHLLARTCLEQAVQEDPNYGAAWAWLGVMHAEAYGQDYNREPDSLEKALAATEKGVELAPLSGRAHANLAFTLNFMRDPAAIDEAEEAVRLAPHDPGTLMAMGFVIGYAGNWARDAALMDKGFQLSTTPPVWAYADRALAAYHQGKFEEAYRFIKQKSWEDHFWTPLTRAAVLAELGRPEEAAESVAHALELKPDIAAQIWNEFHRKWGWSRKDVATFAASLRKAGLDIPDDPTAAD